ncbi:MAG: radical SAM protein [Thioalkalispiraceae bacterium]|jgi:wyosine [tRNA(Phe)-imidazoG37] synthetase (radical SAM superfamily)
MDIGESAMITFGPVPSRRLGRSLGINNIPPKFCSYSCLYCQVGRTANREVLPRTFYQPQQILQAVTTRVSAVQAAGEKIDYLTFVPDGEPTLDIHLGETIRLLRSLNIRIAVISNASLIWREDVQTVLNNADLVSVKIDSIDEDTWKKINRPHDSLKLTEILQGISSFAEHYQGKLITETMLVAGINDDNENISNVASYISELQPDKAYISVPTRPTSETHIHPPQEKVIVQAHTIFEDKIDKVECLVSDEGNAFAFTGNIEQDLLSITAVHPMREEAVNTMLAKAGEQWAVVESLLASNKLKCVEFAGKRFYVRCLPTGE